MVRRPGASRPSPSVWRSAPWPPRRTNRPGEGTWARYALNAGQVDTALAFADAAVSMAPDDAECLGLRGMALARLGRFDEAEADFRAALALDPTQREAVVGMKRLGELR
jgi:tetratricopeptide (TPR) repeat protein